MKTMDLVMRTGRLLLIGMVVIIVHLRAASSSTCQAGHETRYVMAFLAPSSDLVPSSDGLLLRLALLNPSSASNPANVTVHPGGLTLSLLPGVVYSQIRVNTSVALVGSKKQAGGGGVVLTACSSDDVDVVVRGTIKSRASQKHLVNAAFIVPPVESLGVDYVIVTHCEQHRCFVGIVATQPDTRVNVTLRLRHSNDNTITPTLFYEDLRFDDGDVIEEVLDQFQAMQILCDTCDMSGSRVTASSPVAVLAGGELTTIGQISTKADTLLEFLPPTDALGTRHVVAKDTESRFTLKVVALHKGTIFTLSTASSPCHLADSDGDTWTLTLPKQSSSAVLDSTLPVLVSLIICDVNSSNDARMTVVFPVSQWTNASLHLFPPFYSKTNYVVLVVQYSDILAGCLSVSGSEVSTVADPPLGNPVQGVSELRVLRVPLTRTEFYVLSCSSSCSSCSPYWGYVHGTDNSMEKGWAMPLATFRRMPSQSPPQSGSILSQYSYLVPVSTPSTSPAVSPTPVSMEMTSSGSTPSSVFLEIMSTVAEAFSSVSASPSREIEASYSGLDVSIELSEEVFITSYTTSSEEVFSTSYAKSSEDIFSTSHTWSSEDVFRTSYTTSNDEVFITTATTSSKNIFVSSTAAEAETAVTTLQTTTASDFPVTQPSTQSTKTKAAGITCRCRCKHRSAIPNTTIHPLPDYHEILLLSQTSRQRNRKQSVPDRRLSATAIGSCGVSVLVGVLLIIVCSDLTNLLAFFQRAKVQSARRM